MTDASAGPIYSDWIDLEEPIVRGEQTIAQLRLRRPRSGELRGLKISALSQADVDEVSTLLPRIVDPMVTAHDVAAMHPADFSACASEVVSFLLSKAQRQALGIA